MSLDGQEREALEFYADKSNWLEQRKSTGLWPSEADIDRGKVARTALNETKSSSSGTVREEPPDAWMVTRIRSVLEGDDVPSNVAEGQANMIVTALAHEDTERPDGPRQELADSERLRADLLTEIDELLARRDTERCREELAEALGITKAPCASNGWFQLLHHAEALTSVVRDRASRHGCTFSEELRNLVRDTERQEHER